MNNKQQNPQFNIDAISNNVSRFNYNAIDINDAIDYIKRRAKQLLRHYYQLISIEEFEWGVSAIFKKDGEIFQSLYILDQYRGKGIFKKNIKHKILTSYECDIIDYLNKNNIEHVCVRLTPFVEYEIISNFYGDKKAKRNGVELMNHIDEGLYILEKIGASDISKKAYCLHPIIQSDEALVENYESLKNMDVQTIISLVEYRSVANEYLSKRRIENISEIRLSPLKDVNDMLIADKIQNKKDFDLYHLGKHERSNELNTYFNNWLQRLSITNDFYLDCVQYCL